MPITISRQHQAAATASAGGTRGSRSVTWLLRRWMDPNISCALDRPSCHAAVQRHDALVAPCVDLATDLATYGQVRFAKHANGEQRRTRTYARFRITRAAVHGRHTSWPRASFTEPSMGTASNSPASST